MIDLSILRECGTTNERLREFFMAELPAEPDKLRAIDGQTQKKIQRDIEMRERLERRIGTWLNEHIAYTLLNHQFYAAVDLAWDSSPINKTNMPLIMYAQGRIDLSQAVKALRGVPDGQEFLKKNDAGQIVDIDIPRFFETNINLIRSVITRRASAQANKYNSLFPWFKYESRSQGPLGRLRADLVSQRMDIMADQYDYRHLQTQVTRDMLLYGHCVVFPRASWEREVQWERRANDPTLTPDDAKSYRNRVVKEGISWVNPHPSRVFYDNAYPLSSLNTDTGCEFCGFWDVMRKRDIKMNPAFFKREAANSQQQMDWLATYATYFNQYYTTVIIPTPGSMDSTAANDRKNMIGLYSDDEDIPIYLTDLFIKVRPTGWHWGTYPHPVWVHLRVAGSDTVVFAELMPSSPASVFSFNENDARLLNLSLAHELMPYQDQLSNLFTLLLETIKRDMFTVTMMNESVFPNTPEGNEARKKFKAAMDGANWFVNHHVLFIQFEKMEQLGVKLDNDNIIKLVRGTPQQQITAIFNAIGALISMADRLMIMSNQEQGQSESHEITAAQSGLMAASTASVYTFFSDAIDEGRASMKRICYESLIAFGANDIYLPVSRKYPPRILAAAGLQPDLTEFDEQPQRYFNVRGVKSALIHDYIFTVRDGAMRAVSMEAAKLIVELFGRLGTMAQPLQEAIFGAMGKEKVYEMVNTIFQLADTGIDLNLELAPGEDNALLPSANQKLMEQLQNLANIVQQHQTEISALRQSMGGQVNPAMN